MSGRRPRRVIVVDIETTGVRAGARITEIAAITSDAGELCDPWSVELAGSDDDALREALKTLRERIADTTAVMHNAGFDLRALSSEAARVGVANPIRRALCTRRIAQRALRDCSGFDLQSVARALGFKERVEHRALSDATLTARVYEALRSRG